MYVTMSSVLFDTCNSDPVPKGSLQLFPFLYFFPNDGKFDFHYLKDIYLFAQS